MGSFVQFLTEYGYTGMLIAAFLAGSFVPFSSEAVMLGLYAAGLHPWALIISGTIGNVAGSMFNYGIGRFGNPDWISKYLHVKQKDLDKAKKIMAGRGAWMGVFAFLPILGSAISIVLGLMRSNIIISIISMSIGKILRYIILIFGASLIFG
ncbi:MAG: DedA family protein [Prevotella sp.]|jgi:membrane protein YqaA with SNARE-associated domain|nr:DedA family protein [Prevotella sp.]